MEDSIKKLLIFSVGAAIGVAASWKYFKTKYETIANEEINSVKETFSRQRKNEKYNKVEEIEHKPEPEVNKNAEKYSKILADLKYTNEETEEDEGDDNMKGPYVIPPDEFGDYYEYDTVELTYYADGVVEDDEGNVLDDADIEDKIGKESLEHFGEWEDDSVYVRNEKLQTDYQILADERNYPDVFDSAY